MFKFPGGEINIKISSKETIMKFHLSSSDKIMEMLLCAEAHNSMFGDFSLNAIIPYVPYARQDRRCNKGEALSIAVMASLINQCKFKSVKIYDPHSLVAPSLIERVVVYTQFDIFFPSSDIDWKETVIIAPDLGAAKKSEDFALKAGAKGLVQCAKKRDLQTGKLSGFRVLDDSDLIHQNDIVIIDDICDGGGTFLGLLPELKWYEPKSVTLMVTHGIFSKGTECLTSVFDKIITTNSWNEELVGNDKLEVIKI